MRGSTLVRVSVQETCIWFLQSKHFRKSVEILLYRKYLLVLRQFSFFFFLPPEPWLETHSMQLQLRRILLQNARSSWVPMCIRIYIVQQYCLYRYMVVVVSPGSRSSDGGGDRVLYNTLTLRTFLFYTHIEVYAFFTADPVASRSLAARRRRREIIFRCAARTDSYSGERWTNRRRYARYCAIRVHTRHDGTIHEVR